MVLKINSNVNRKYQRVYRQRVKRQSPPSHAQKSRTNERYDGVGFVGKEKKEKGNLDDVLSNH